MQDSFTSVEFYYSSNLLYAVAGTSIGIEESIVVGTDTSVSSFTSQSVVTWECEGEGAGGKGEGKG